jgi:hypothetical protein
VAPVEVAAKAASTGTKVAVGVGVGAAAATAKARKKREKEECTPEPCDVLPVIWPSELPRLYRDFESTRDFKRQGRNEREWEGIDRAAEQTDFAKCLKRALKRGEDRQEQCGHLGGEWFDPDLLPAEPADAHHLHPLYLGGAEGSDNLGAVEFNRHRLGHKLLNDQTEMFETDPTWLHCREQKMVCSPFLTRHPVGQEYEVYEGF